ncbi:MAG TPA: DUF5060 domain-containing protein, partial [Bdellovibrionota bacterium]|nr:DUF5060 domain-containing protein [Bdellovibrionota bacterium]
MLKLSQVAITLFTTLSLTALAGIPAVQHQSVTIDFAGPTSSESAASPQNPFLDYRLNVRFTHGPSGKTYLVPGFFDGDGNGGGSGNVWRVRFTPDLAGTWSYAAELRYGTQVAVSLDPVAGAAQNLPEASGELDVATFDPDAPGFLKWGRLDYVGEHYLKFQNGPYFVKVGADDPEDFFGYTGFDDVTTTGKHHTFAAHDGDWRSGDPDWNGGKGKNLIGALNYLADQGINSVYIILMNIGGDGQNTHPYLKTVSLSGSTTNDNLHFDISRLAQWEIAMAHAQRRGLNLHLVLGEAEEKNKKELDNATLGVERKLYYRELAARFGHHQALQWNLNEEYD